MALFKCDKCGAIENTALTACSWGHDKHLCSECCSGIWHGRFPKEYVLKDGETDVFKDN